MFDRLDMSVLNRHLDFLVGQREISLSKSIGPYQTWNDQVIELHWQVSGGGVIYATRQAQRAICVRDHF